jgi:hypothetical protein
MVSSAVGRSLSMNRVRRWHGLRLLAAGIGFVDYWRMRVWPAQCHSVGNDFSCE